MAAWGDGCSCNELVILSEAKNLGSSPLATNNKLRRFFAQNDSLIMLLRRGSRYFGPAVGSFSATRSPGISPPATATWLSPRLATWMSRSWNFEPLST